MLEEYVDVGTTLQGHKNVLIDLKIAVDFGKSDRSVIQTRLFAVARQCFLWPRQANKGSCIPCFQHSLKQVRLGLLFCLVCGIRQEIEVNSKTLILPKSCLCCCLFYAACAPIISMER